MARKIIAGIVTYNDYDLLENLIQSLSRQSVDIYHYIIIDNSDNCYQHKLLQKFQGNKFTIIQNPKNNGSAGGFKQILELAIKKGDFLWTLDQDIEFSENALFHLIERYKEISSTEESKNIAVVRSWYKDSHTSKSWYVEEFPWRGALFNLKLIPENCLPDEGLFLYACDIDYSYKLAKHGLKFIVEPKSVMKESQKSIFLKTYLWNGEIEYYESPLRLYYSIRNGIITYIKHSKFKKLIKLLKDSIKIFFAIRVDGYPYSKIRQKILIRAIKDGFFFNSGKSNYLNKKLISIENSYN